MLQWFAALFLFSFVNASPMCSCPNGMLGVSCPPPVQMNCPPPPQCPTQQPCLFPQHTFPTLPPVSGLGNGQAPGFPTLPPHSFTLGTLPPHPGIPGFPGFGGSGGFTPPPPPAVPQTLPPAPIPPTNGNELLVPINNPQGENTYTDVVVQAPQPPPFSQQQNQFIPPAPQPAQPFPQYPQPQQGGGFGNFAGNNVGNNGGYGAGNGAGYGNGGHNNGPTVHVIDQTSTTTASPTPSPETYVDLESPEGAPVQMGTQIQTAAAPLQGQGSNNAKFFENEPNNGFRAPVRSAAPNTKGEGLSEKCNDERLRNIIIENIDKNPSTSKRKIQKAATEEIGGLFDVICSAHDFSYLANTQMFCEAGNDDITCFAFLHSLIQ